MSHTKVREENLCLNCGTSLFGRYCHVCGQENIEPRHSTWHLFTHFFYDITHFDGKFFTTLKDLAVKPGFLSREYMQGRRESYLHPIRMYVFTSAIFFVIFFSLFNLDNLTFMDKVKFNTASVEDLKQENLRKAKTREDSVAVEAAYGWIKEYRENLKPGNDSLTLIKSKTPGRLSYASMKQYDSVQRSLPENLRDGWIRRSITKKVVEINQHYRGDKKAFSKEFLTALLHNFPKLLFVSLPLFALMLKLLYVRRKQFYYVDHSIFSIHLYVYYFIALLAYIAVIGLENLSGWNWIWVLNAGIGIYSLYYTYKAMRNFYGQGWFKTLVKWLVLGISSIMLILFLFLIFIFFSILEV